MVYLPIEFYTFVFVDDTKIAMVTETRSDCLGLQDDKFKDLHCVKLLLYAFVKSKLEYCYIVWHPYQQVYGTCIS